MSTFKLAISLRCKPQNMFITRASTKNVENPSLKMGTGFIIPAQIILVPRTPVSFGHVVGETEGNGTNKTSSSGDENGRKSPSDVFCACAKYEYV